jgi:vacuolar-type H+-ATPase subunit I/STV1
MSFGLILKIANEVKRGQKKQIVFDSVPRLLLMLCTVGFLVLLIIVKWLNNYEDREY